MKNYIIYESAVSSTPEVMQTYKPNIVKFVACLIDCDVKNRNGRVYPRDVIEQALENPIFQNTLQQKRLFCEMGHPFEENLQRQTTIDPNNICCVIDDIYWEGNKLMAHMETTDTHLGHDVAGLIRQGCQIAFSMRAKGSVIQMDGYKQVRPGLNIVSWDMVVVPSHEHAVMERIISEQTASSMFNYGKYGNRQMALCESLNISENGLMIDCDEIKNTVDYSAFHLQRFKPASKVYVYNEADQIVSVDGNNLMLESNNCSKKVNIEDYLTKVARNKLVDLRESSMTGIAPVYTPTGVEKALALAEVEEEPTGPSTEYITPDHASYEITKSLDKIPSDQDDLPEELKNKSVEEIKDIVKEDLETLLNCSENEMDAFEYLYSEEYVGFLYKTLYESLVEYKYLSEAKSVYGSDAEADRIGDNQKVYIKNKYIEDKRKYEQEKQKRKEQYKKEKNEALKQTKEDIYKKRNAKDETGKPLNPEKYKGGFSRAMSKVKTVAKDITHMGDDYKEYRERVKDLKRDLKEKEPHGEKSALRKDKKRSIKNINTALKSIRGMKTNKITSDEAEEMYKRNTNLQLHSPAELAGQPAKKIEKPVEKETSQKQEKVEKPKESKADKKPVETAKPETKPEKPAVTKEKESKADKKPVENTKSEKTEVKETKPKTKTSRKDSAIDNLEKQKEDLQNQMQNSTDENERAKIKARIEEINDKIKEEREKEEQIFLRPAN